MSRVEIMYLVKGIRMLLKVARSLSAHITHIIGARRYNRIKSGYTTDRFFFVSFNNEESSQVSEPTFASHEKLPASLAVESNFNMQVSSTKSRG